MMKILDMIKAKIKAKWSREPKHEVIFDLGPGDVVSLRDVDTEREYMMIKIAPGSGHPHHRVRAVVEIDEDDNMRAVSFIFPVNTTGTVLLRSGADGKAD